MMRAVVLHVHRCALCGHECGYAVSEALKLWDTATRGDVAGRCDGWCGVWSLLNVMFEDAVDAGVSMEGQRC